MTEHNMTCGHCGGTWNDKETPTPAARCPYEYDHEYDNHDNENKEVTDMRDYIAKEIKDCDESILDEIVRVRRILNQLETDIHRGATVTRNPLAISVERIGIELTMRNTLRDLARHP